MTGISYDPKVDPLLSRLRSRPVGTAESLDAGKLRALLEGYVLEEEDEQRRRDREARAEHMRSAAARNVERALELLK